MQIQSGSFGSNSSIICSLHKTKYDLNEHIHQFSEIVYMISGEMKVTVDGVTETARAGDIIVIPPLSVHSYFTPEYNEHWMCSFSGNFVHDIISEKDLYKRRERCVFQASNGLRAYIDERLLDAEEKPLTLTAEMTRFFKASLHTIFDEYLRKVPEIIGEYEYSNVISKIIKYLNEHYTENVTLKSVGKKLGYSPKYISDSIGKIEDLNFRYILNSFRIEKAARLLKTTNLKVTDISLECGFASERSFRRAFLKIVGQSPLKYRHQNQKA